MNEIIVDFTVLENLPANDRISELNLVDIFLAERERLKRVIAGMGLNAADSEDVLQDVSIRALKQTEKLGDKAGMCSMADKGNNKPVLSRASKAAEFSPKGRRNPQEKTGK